MKKLVLLLAIIAGFIISGCMPSAPGGVTGGSYTYADCQGKPDAKFDPSRAADKIVVHRSSRTMDIYKNGSIIKTFRVSLGSNSSRGPKVSQGDYKTPRGSYTILDKRCHRVKYRAMTISYPNAQDRARAAKLGVNPGSMITIHGQPHWNADGHGDNYTLSRDWTNGCVALSNSDLDWLWGSVRVGTPIIIE